MGFQLAMVRRWRNVASIDTTGSSPSTLTRSCSGSNAIGPVANGTAITCARFRQTGRGARGDRSLPGIHPAGAYLDYRWTKTANRPYHGRNSLSMFARRGEASCVGREPSAELLKPGGIATTLETGQQWD